MTRPNKEELERLYQSISSIEIGRRYGVSATSVQRWFKRYGIQTKPAEKYTNDEIAGRYAEGATVDELIELTGYTETHIYRKLQAANVKLRPKQTLIDTVDRQYLHDLYHNQELSTNQIAPLLGCSQQKVSSLLRAFGYEARDYQEAGLLRSDKISAQMRKQWENEDYRKLISKGFASVKEKMAHLAADQLGRISNIQKILYSLLDDIDVRYEPEKTIGFWTYDAFLPDHNLVIECQGDYWHQRPEAIIKDKQKASYLANLPQYILKYIWEHEFKCKDRILDLLRYWTGTTQSQLDFDFDRLVIEPIDRLESELFLGKYHYAGRVNKSGIGYAAKLGETVIAVCVFDYPTRSESTTRLVLKSKQLIELVRFCIHPSYQKKNLASWFISKCLRSLKAKKPELKCVISFADSTFGHSGTIYRASNWICDGETKPSYWYADADGYVMHKKTLWDHATKMQLSETEYAEKYGYTKILGKPKHRFLWYFDEQRLLTTTSMGRTTTVEVGETGE